MPTVGISQARGRRRRALRRHWQIPVATVAAHALARGDDRRSAFSPPAAGPGSGVVSGQAVRVQLDDAFSPEPLPGWLRPERRAVR